MTVVYDPAFLEKLKKLDVRVKKSFKKRILIFSQNPNDLVFNNHPLKEEYEGYSSIDITVDYRALYKEAQIGEEVVAYFVMLGTHQELYGKRDGES